MSRRSRPPAQPTASSGGAPFLRGVRLVLFLDETGVRPTTLEQTAHFQITRGMLSNAEAYGRHLRAAAGSDEPAEDAS